MKKQDLYVNSFIHLSFASIYDNKNSLIKDENRIKYVFLIAGIQKYKQFYSIFNTQFVKNLSAEDSERKINEALMQQRNSEEVESYGVVLDMTDQLTLLPIKYPVRGNYCEHIACFCLKNFLQNLVDSQHKRMTCPLCGEIMTRFIFDKLISTIIKNKSQDVEQITITKTEELLKLIEELRQKRNEEN